MEGNRMAFQIQQEQCTSSELAQHGDHADHFAIGEMMQYRRAKHKIECMPGEWKLEQVSYYLR